MRTRNAVLAAVLAGAALAGLAAPASAQCSPQIVDTGDPCPDGCKLPNEAYNKVNHALGSPTHDSPFLCTQ